MSINMVRQPSETPNIKNIDDIVPFRYAYGNQNGYVLGKGNELSHLVNGSDFRINSGRVVLQGVESDIDANGVVITIENVTETRYFSVYYQVNLANNTVSIKSEFDTAGYPAIDEGDDLTKNNSGIANLELYRFAALSGEISNVQKIVKQIPYPLTNYDITKGTIEERLTRLGFKQGELVIDTTNLSSTTSITKNSLSRQGNYVIGDLEINDSSTSLTGMYLIGANQNQIIQIPSEFIPLGNTSISAYVKYACMDTSNFSSYTQYSYEKITVSSDGFVPIPDMNYSTLVGYVKTIKIHFGYEAQPL